MLKKVAFTMYPVDNLQRAIEFYKTNLGLNPSKVSAQGAWIEYDLPEGGCFALTTLAKGKKPAANAGGSIAFEVDNLDELVTQLKANHVTFKLDTFMSPVCKMAVIVDSEGNAVTLHQLHQKG